MSSKNDCNLPSSARPWSLAARLTLWYSISAFVLVLFAVGYLYWALTASLDREADRFLGDEIHIIRGILRDRPDDANAIKQEVEWESADRLFAQLYVRILDENESTRLQSPEMNELLPLVVFPPACAADEEPGHGMELQRNAGSEAERTFRVISARAWLGEPARTTHIVQVALDRTHEQVLLADYRRNLWLVLVFALVACALGGYQIARRGIRPIRDIARTAQRIRSTTLNERMATSGLPSELLELADTFNHMLNRLEESFTRLARFSADIAHELRTPVNNLRGEVEVSLGKPRTPDQYREVLGSCLEETVRLSRLIDSLLFLARAENPRMQITREPRQLAPELQILREFYEVAASERQIDLRVQAGDDVVAEIDRTLFQRAVGNLIENALMHSDQNGTITVSARIESGFAVVRVADLGHGIPSEDVQHIFDRFYRVDRSRSVSTGGLGLGMAIVKSIVEIHGGAIALESTLGKGTTVTLRFPMADHSDVTGRSHQVGPAIPIC